MQEIISSTELQWENSTALLMQKRQPALSRYEYAYEVIHSASFVQIIVSLHPPYNSRCQSLPEHHLSIPAKLSPSLCTSTLQFLLFVLPTIAPLYAECLPGQEQVSLSTLETLLGRP